MTDCRDGKTYKTVVIGTQTWMADNLAYLPSVNANADTSSTIAKYYVYGYDGTSVADAKAKPNYTTYGVLYNWPATMSNVCPYGWHVPTSNELTTLETYVGGSDVAGKALKAMNTAWKVNDGEDTYGFHAMPGGRHFESSFGDLGECSFLWTSTMYNNELASSRYLFYMVSEMNAYNKDKFIGYSVRCLKN